MEPATITAVGALLLSAIVTFFQGVRWVQELRERASTASDKATKSEAERDSVVVKSAEGALMIMRGMLEVAKSEGSELRAENRELQNRVKDLEIQTEALEKKNRELEKLLHREREEAAEARKLFEDRIKSIAEQYDNRLVRLEESSHEPPETDPGKESA